MAFKQMRGNKINMKGTNGIRGMKRKPTMGSDRMANEIGATFCIT